MAGEVTFHLEVFDGPLDLLLHLLSKNKVDIKDIPIAEITEQYLEYIRRMEEFNLEVASEFISMAAQLMYIKSKMLLPSYEEEAENDPKAALIEALLEYQQFKQISGVLGGMGEIGRDVFVRHQEILEKDRSKLQVKGSMEELIRAVDAIFQRAETRRPPPVSSFAGIVDRKSVPVSHKLNQIINLFLSREEIDLEELVLESESRSELVALFLAVLELSKAHRVVIEDKPERGYILRLAGPEDPENYTSEDSDGNQ